MAYERVALQSKMLAHGEVSKMKKKPLSPDLKYDAPHRRKKERKKRVKNMGNGLIGLNGSLSLLKTMLMIQVLRNQPLDHEGQTVKLMTLKKRYVGDNPRNCVFLFLVVFYFAGIKRRLHKEHHHLLPDKLYQQRLIRSGVDHRSRATRVKSFFVASAIKYCEFSLSLFLRY